MKLYFLKVNPSQQIKTNISINNIYGWLWQRKYNIILKKAIPEIINSLLPSEVWLYIPETSPQAYFLVRSVNRNVKSYTNENPDRYELLFYIEKCTDNYR